MSELQQTNEWIKARLGKATASRMSWHKPCLRTQKFQAS
jgi:hypothetical protein